MNQRETIYVALLDEGIDVWRPVEAERLSPDRYRILYPPCDILTHPGCKIRGGVIHRAAW